ncbi:MAG: PEGA domain-containing protein, partial [Deltaproteobacteria bacterium]|nr:PEGA domain-containing protein [Deltaproteobacteria bacterium]
LPILFRAPAGIIKIADVPRDASIYLEAYFDYNKFLARPVKLQNIVLNKPIYAPFGRYILELRRLKQVGDPSNLIEDIVYRREFYLREDQPVFVVDVTDTGLNQFPAVVRSEPAGADVFIDGRKVGTTPFRGDLPVGKHRLTLRKEGYFEETQEIEADINTPFKTEITLRTSLAGEKLNLAKSFMRQKAYDSALQTLSQVFNLVPTAGETAEARFLLGNVYLGLGEAVKAAGYFEQAKQDERYKYWGQLGLARVFAAQGRTAQALVPLVDVLLNAQEEEALKEGHNLLREISPLRSVVYIQSDPPGAEVYLNDKKLAQATPVLLHEMGLGSYKIRLMKTGFQPLDLNINLSVNEFNPVLAKLKSLPE